MDRQVDTLTWAIVIFPELSPEQRQIIARIRAAYDPLAMAIDPHITLVFPFESMLPTEDLLAHMRAAVVPITPFEIALRGVTGQQDEWLFLNVKRGNDQLIALHDRLYSGPLESYLLPRYTYAPHLTVGHVTPGEPFETALQKVAGVTAAFHTVVRKITAYRIANNGSRGEHYSVSLSD